METLNHVSAFPAIYMVMIHTRAVSSIQLKPTNLPRTLPFYFLPTSSLGSPELGVSILWGRGSSFICDPMRKGFLGPSTVGLSHRCGRLRSEAGLCPLLEKSQMPRYTVVAQGRAGTGLGAEEAVVPGELSVTCIGLPGTLVKHASPRAPSSHGGMGLGQGQSQATGPVQPQHPPAHPSHPSLHFEGPCAWFQCLLVYPGISHL